MNQPPRARPDVEPSRSFDLVADAYDRGRPSYPDEAVSWVLRGLIEGGAAPRVLEAGAGTGKLTRQLVDRGCTVTATDPSLPMLTRARAHLAHAHLAAGTAEQLPARARSVDLVVAAQSHHWFDAERFLAEAARVLRRGGKLAVLWNTRDERIPWVRRLGRIIGTRPQTDDLAVAIDESAMFESVERTSFRFWQPMTRASLRDLVSSRSSVAVMSDLERDRVLHAVDELYEGYGRGHDGMLLPYVTTVCRTTVLPWAVPPDPRRHSPQEPPRDPPQNPTSDAGGGSLPSGGADDPGGAGDLLIDFR